MPGNRGRYRAPLGIDDDEQIFAQRLTAQRRKLAAAYVGEGRNPYSQASIARKLGISQSALHLWETPYCIGSRSFAMWRRWAELLGGPKFTVRLE